MRVVIGEDEALLREGLVLVLERAGIEVAGSASDADEVVDLVHRHRPDVLVTDIRMPPTHTDDGLRAAVRVRAEAPGPGSSSCPSTSSAGTPASCWGSARRVSATCSSTGSPTASGSATTSIASPTAAPSSTPRSSAR